MCCMDHSASGHIRNVTHHSTSYGGRHGDSWPSLFSNIHSWLSSGNDIAVTKHLTSEFLTSAENLLVNIFMFLNKFSHSIAHRHSWKHIHVMIGRICSDLIRLHLLQAPNSHHFFFWGTYKMVCFYYSYQLLLYPAAIYICIGSRQCLSIRTSAQLKFL